MTVEHQPGADTVISGVACRLPKSENAEEFWQNLMNGVDMVGPTRWPPRLHKLPPRAGHITTLNKFDAKFFGYSDYEADNMNLLMRQLLEVIYECIVDSGLPMKTLQKSRTGFYLACTFSDADCITTSMAKEPKMSNLKQSLVAHMTETFGLSGPVFSVDTACSSSLAALQVAFSDLLIGRCQYAIIAGSNLIVNPSCSLQFHQLGMLSPTGESRAFDIKANGYVRSDGVVAFLLARESSLCRRVYANVVDCGVNCDGYKPEGIVFPSKTSQANLLNSLYGGTHGVDKSLVAYVEAHGTGTLAGDEAELTALSSVFSVGNRKSLLVGSVKSNMGHCEAAACLVGILKCILSINHGRIPPNLNYHVPNPNIDALMEGKIKVVDRATQLTDGFIGVNCFGFGGVNGHVILKPYQAKRKSFTVDSAAMLIPLTVRNKEHAKVMEEFIKKHRSNTDTLNLLVSSIMSHDRNQPIRGYVMLEPTEKDFEAVWSSSTETPVETPPVWLLIDDFVWGNIQYSKSLLRHPAFSESLTDTSQIVLKLDPSCSIMDAVRNEAAVSPLSATGFITCVGLLIGMIDAIKQSGIELAGFIGSGLSNLIAAHYDGCLTKEQCLDICLRIGRCLEAYSKDETSTTQLYRVTMAAEYAYRLGPNYQVLSIVSNNMVIIAVSQAGKEHVTKNIRKWGGSYEELAVTFPLYSPLVTKLSAEVEKVVSTLITSAKQSSAKWLSTSTAAKVTNLKCDVGYVVKLVQSSNNISRIQRKISANACIVHVSASETSSSDHCGCDEICKHKNHCCRLTLPSLLHALGRLHIYGHSVDVSDLTKTQFPLGRDIPLLSPLTRWDHSKDWTVPEWTQFTCTVSSDVSKPYILEQSDVEGVHDPLAILLYHSWKAVSQRKSSSDHTSMCNFQLHDLAVSDLTVYSLIGALVQVHLGRKRVNISNAGDTLMSAAFDIPEDIALPRIPGVDLDLNENLGKGVPECEIQKTEIRWEDSWLEFLNATAEFASQHSYANLATLLVSPKHQQKEVDICASILVVMEKTTGLCKAGGLALQYATADHSIPRPITTDKETPLYTQISTVMLYSFYNTDAARMLVYIGKNTKDQQQVVGIVHVTESGNVTRELPVAKPWSVEDLEILVPYTISSHILYDVVKAKTGQSILVLPPIDTVAMYLLALADQCGCSVFAASCDVETCQLLDSVFPFVRTLRGIHLRSQVLQLTQGQGCDIVIKSTGGDLEQHLEILADHGKLVQCSKPSEFDSIGMSVFLRNICISVIKPEDAFLELINKSSEHLQALLFNMHHEGISKLSDEGYPEDQGVLYKREDHVTFVDPIMLNKLLQVINQPGSKAEDIIGSADILDILAVEKIQQNMNPIPQDCSLAGMEFESASQHNMGMAASSNATSVFDCRTTPFCCAPHIFVSSPIPRPVSSSLRQRRSPPGMITPVISIIINPDIEPGHELNAKKVYAERKGTPMPSSVKPPAGGKRHMLPQRLDMLMVGPPPTPRTPAIAAMFNKCFEPTIISLNSVATDEVPLYIIHPITGKIELFKSLGEKLKIPCYGLQRTRGTPRDSIVAIARFYVDAIEMLNPVGPYRLAGFSFGGLIAMEMAIQMQAQKKQVDTLLMLDGSPDYVHRHCELAKIGAPENVSIEKAVDYREVCYLLMFMELYGPIPQARMVKTGLLHMPTQDARLEMAVDVLSGNIILSPSPRVTRWMTAAQKITRATREDKESKMKMYNAAHEVVRHGRYNKAMEYVKTAFAGENYEQTGVKFEGDVHLFRIKDDPKMEIAMDYGLQALCTGSVKVKFYSGSHHTFLNADINDQLVKDINNIFQAA